MARFPCRSECQPWLSLTLLLPLRLTSLPCPFDSWCRLRHEGNDSQQARAYYRGRDYLDPTLRGTTFAGSLFRRRSAGPGKDRERPLRLLRCSLPHLAGIPQPDGAALLFRALDMSFLLPDRPLESYQRE